LGLISYSIYLWHPLVRDVAARAMGVAQRHGVTGVDWLFVLGMLVVTWLICWVSYLLVEVRGHQFIKWLQKGRPQRPAALEPAAP
jgi:peptidoglycan/LPS O-acetylase OafA/YrhL